jgi:transketolase C-terminal domain/subunit
MRFYPKNKAQGYRSYLNHYLSQDHQHLCISIGEIAKSYLADIEQSHGDQFLFLPEDIENALGICTGLALEGFKPIVHLPSHLIKAGYQMLFHGISYQCLPITIVGLHQYWNEHSALQSFEDLGLLSALPNFWVSELSEQSELKALFDHLSTASPRPMYVKLPLDELPSYFPSLDSQVLQFDQANVLRQGKDLLLISMGLCSAEITRLYAEMDKFRLSWTHLHLTTLSPFPRASVLEHFGEDLKGVITVEAHFTKNALGAEVSKLISENELPKAVKLARLGLQDHFMQGSSMGYLMKKYGFDDLSIVSCAEQFLKRRLNFDLQSLTPNPCLSQGIKLWKSR